MAERPRLKTIKPLVSKISPRIGYVSGDERERDRYRRETQQSKQWLNSKWWRDTRLRVLARDLYTCRMCGLLVAGKGEAHVDHIDPHNEDRAKFFCDDGGLQTLCSTCHSRVKQADERRAGLIR